MPRTRTTATGTGPPPPAMTATSSSLMAVRMAQRRRSFPSPRRRSKRQSERNNWRRRFSFLRPEWRKGSIRWRHKKRRERRAIYHTARRGRLPRPCLATPFTSRTTATLRSSCSRRWRRGRHGSRRRCWPNWRPSRRGSPARTCCVGCVAATTPRGSRPYWRRVSWRGRSGSASSAARRRHARWPRS
ncbi:hypothetical protein AGDE_16199 [Angomonas deanei]|nr:hypothetical protein AGDE_16199 [Angomonas deanei]|eukprot:EPY17559.1 hypothetical protein AGDE_16199 [Angomonas deanei]